MESLIIKIFAFLLGACLGSFLNVIIHRLPSGEDVVFTRSHCPHCKHLIPWYMNIPLISFIVLRARCAWCHTAISPRYFIVELLAGLLGWWLAPNILTPMAGAMFFLNLSILLVFMAIIAIDLKHHLIPNVLNIYLALVFLMIAVLQFSWKHWLIGGLVGFGVPFIVTLLFYKIKGQIGLGGGDIKLYGALGIILGPMGVMENIFFSCFLGALVGAILLMLKLMNRRTPIPFGPFIVLVAAVQIYLPKYFKLIQGLLLPSL